MKVLLLKACEYCVQQVNGRHALIGLFDNIVSPMIPVDHPPFVVCVQLEFGPEEGGQSFQLLVRLIDEDGKRLFEVPVQGSAPSDPGGSFSRVFASFHVPGLRLETTGEYRIDLLYNGKEEAEERIPVLIAPPNPG